MALSTGTKVLDDILYGGYPEGHTTLLSGTPGTGKSTLAMQFLQAGLDAGDRCVFISTEQTIEELRDSFGGFSFDLEHPDLDITSIHARTGRSLESERSDLVVETLDDDVVVEGFSVAFTSDRIAEVLERYRDADRIVLDSVSGLRPMADDEELFRRGVIDLIQRFNTDFGATAVFTAEHVGGDPSTQQVETLALDNAVQYSVHGVIRLWRERVRGTFRRYLDVMKMRGVDHDSRRFELQFDDDGVAVIPRNRTVPSELAMRERLSTGIPKLDELVGGGLPVGTGTHLEHDGQANLGQLLFQMASNAIEDGYTLAMVPGVDSSPESAREFFHRAGTSMAEMRESDCFYVLDAIGAWRDEPNVVELQQEDASITYLVDDITENHGGDGLFLLVYTESLVHALGREETRRFRYWVEANFFDEGNILVDVTNPNVMDDEMADFFVDSASQVIETWREESGLQYLKLQKGEGGDVGSVRLVDHMAEPPYIRLA